MTTAKSFIKNTGMSITTQVVMLFVRFFVRSIFIKTIGMELLGYNATFGNILSLLNLSELGIGYAITYKLYEPFAKKDYGSIAGYLSVYKRFYSVIILAVTAGGILICPVLPLLTKTDNGQLGFLASIFLLQLGKTVATYFLQYVRVILNIQEKNYLLSFVDFVTNLCVAVLQIAALICLGNYVIYLIIDAVGILFANIFIYRYVCKKYKYIFSIKKQKEELRSVFADVKKQLKNVVIVKLGGYILNSTDYVVISSILGTIYSGLLSNYNMIFAQFQTLILVAMNSVQSILGNAIYRSGKDSVLRLVIKFTQILGIISLLFCPAAFVLIDDFVTLWIGSEYILDISIALCLSVNVVLMLLSNPISLLFGSLGYYNFDKKIILSSATLNIIVSVILCKSYGVVGVLFGTTLALLTYWISRVVILKKQYFSHMGTYLPIVAVLVLGIMAQYLYAIVIDRMVTIPGTYMEFIVKGILIETPAVIVAAIYLIRRRRRDE